MTQQNKPQFLQCCEAPKKEWLVLKLWSNWYYMIWKIVTKKMRLSMRLSKSHKITIDYKNNIAIYNYIIYIIYIYGFQGAPCPHFRRVETSVACFWRKLPLGLTPNPRRETQGRWMRHHFIVPHGSHGPEKWPAGECLGGASGCTFLGGWFFISWFVGTGEWQRGSPAEGGSAVKRSSAERGLRQFVGGDVALPWEKGPEPNASWKP